MAEETLKEILEQTRKEAKFSKMIAFIMLAILLIILVALILVVPQVLSMMREIEQTALDAQEIVTRATATLDELTVTLDSVDDMTGSITKAGDAMFDGIGKVDFDALSKAITDLQDAIEPLANFSRMLGGR